jgi:hypothetical protein
MPHPKRPLPQSVCHPHPLHGMLVTLLHRKGQPQRVHKIAIFASRGPEASPLLVRAIEGRLRTGRRECSSLENATPKNKAENRSQFLLILGGLAVSAKK